MSTGRRVGLLHPGEMGAAIGASLRARGHDVLWSSPGRSAASAERAAGVGLRDAGSLAALLAEAEVVLSIVPPGAAEEVAMAVADHGFEGVFADCNALAPETAARVGETAARGGARTADGGIVGMPPDASSGPRLYLSGPAAPEVEALFAGSTVEARVLPGSATAASTLKMLYAGWTKGSAALLLALAEAAERAGLTEVLTQEWQHSQPGLPERLARARTDAETKGGRWAAEMEQIALTLEALGEPPGFHQAAATVFARR